MAICIDDSDGVDLLPRAPSEEEWARMTEAERAACVEALPAQMTDAECLPPEGDLHRDAKSDALDVLREFFRRTGRKVYVAADLTVYYPGVRRFSPDVLAVIGAEPHPRMKWVVGAEGRGLDWVLEVHVAGDRRKDMERNVELYARLGIPEYFIYDRARQRLSGFVLPAPGAKQYRPMVPQAGFFGSSVLGLELRVEDGRVRYYHGNAQLLDASELIAKLERLSEQQALRAEEESRRAEEGSRRAEEESRRAEEESRRAEEESRRAEEESRRAEQLTRRVAELEAQLEAQLAKRR